ncbi:c-type cytochrome [Arenibacterium halophilum]|jgi:cytochrome c556|nr:cytochrome c [Arenibacterium halophilum]|tara:strand:- start:791 stop:1273 length:483 start_codon:yes stop_codon:yes gene_type:complete
MTFKKTLLAGLALAGIAATAAIGDSHADKAAMQAVKARQATMQLYAFNLGTLGGMAKGEIDYDAEAASAAANNLAALSGMNQMAMWPMGSDSDTLGEATSALPAIWAEGSDIGDHSAALHEAATALASTAGDGLDALRGGIGAVGKECGACHEDYRKPNS